MDNRLKLARPDLKEREEGRFFILLSKHFAQIENV